MPAVTRFAKEGPGSLTIMPAIDLRAGKVVRLLKGDYDKQTQYAVDPIEQASRYAAAGATWLHVVNLDGARTGDETNTEIVGRLAATGLRIQAGGGVRNKRDVERLLRAGAQRVVVGSLAVRDPERVMRWLEEFGCDHLMLALDARWRRGAWRLASAGWTQAEKISLDELAPRYAEAGARHLLCTDIDRDGTLSGPNWTLLARLRRLVPTMAIQLSGGVRSAADVTSARQAGAAAIIIGRALLEHQFTLGEILSC